MNSRWTTEYKWKQMLQRRGSRIVINSSQSPHVFPNKLICPQHIAKPYWLLPAFLYEIMIVTSWHSGLLAKEHASPGCSLFPKKLLPPGGWGREVHTHIGGCPSRKPCRLTSESPKFDFFQIWQSGSAPDLETQGKQKSKAIDPVFGIHILVTFKYIFSKLTYRNVIILLNIHVYFHSTYIHDVKEKMGS